MQLYEVQPERGESVSSIHTPVCGLNQRRRQVPEGNINVQVAFMGAAFALPGSSVSAFAR